MLLAKESDFCPFGSGTSAALSECPRTRNLVKLRAERGWSQEDLADEAGLHRTYVSGIERRVRNPTILIIERLAKAFKVKVGELFD
jgi:transcriptional regulator with XRE-family HTH domain